MKPLGHRQYDLLLDMHVREKLGDPVVWAELTALGRRRAGGLLKRKLIYVRWVSMTGGPAGQGFLTDAGRAVLSPTRDKAL